MSLKKVEQVKKDKGFRLLDLIIYAVIAALVAAVFIAVFATKNKSPLTGIRIYVSAQVVFEYEFGGTPAYEEWVEVEEDGNGVTVTLNLDGELNVVYVDKTARTAKMIDANCKGRQCLYFSAIDDNNKVIYCDPHNLKIEPYSRNFDDPNLII